MRLQLPTIHFPDRERLQAALRYAFSPRVLAQALVIGALIAVAVAIWPQFTCRVFAQCGPREKWCSWGQNCNYSCANSSSFWDVDPYAYYGQVAYQPGKGYYCSGPVRHRVVVRCDDPKSCRSTSTSPPHDMYGNSIVVKHDVKLPCSGRNCARYVGATCRLAFTPKQVTCCIRGAAPPPSPPKPKPAPKVCTPAWKNPEVDLSTFTTDPRYPIVYGQDPDRRGITLSGITVRGGKDANGCQPRRTLSRVTVSITLDPRSATWIQTDLALLYPGAHVKGHYPITFTPSVAGQRTVTLPPLHFENLDPGDYVITITVQDDLGHVTTVTKQVFSALFSFFVH